MAKEKTIVALLVLFILVLALFGYVYSCSQDSSSLQDNMKQTTVLKTANTGTEYATSSTRGDIVNSQVVNSYDSGSQVVVANSDGSKTIVKGGTVLVDGKVISNDGTTSSVYDTNTQRTVSSN